MRPWLGCPHLSKNFSLLAVSGGVEDVLLEGGPTVYYCLLLSTAVGWANTINSA